MVLNRQAPVAPRLRWRWQFGVAALSILAIGCGHRRQSLRPVFRSPAAISAPCTNCGSGSGAVITAPPASSGRTLSSEPALDEPVGATESAVPSLEPSSGTARSSQGSGSERSPRATIGNEPELNMLPESAAKPKGTSGSNSPSSGGGRAPALLGPSASRGTRDTVRTASAPVESRGAQDRLKPYLGEPGGDELFYPNKADRPWKYIVLHHSASAEGGYDQIDAEHRKVLGYDGCGYHFVIGNGTGSADGQIEIARRWVNQKHGVHCRNAKNSEVDEYGIGICLVGDLDKTPPTPRQVAAAKALIAYLETRYSIGQDRVETHAHLAATPTVCPGRHFPARELLASEGFEVDDELVARRPVPASWRVVRRAGTPAQ